MLARLRSVYRRSLVALRDLKFFLFLIALMLFILGGVIASAVWRVVCCSAVAYSWLLAVAVATHEPLFVVGYACLVAKSIHLNRRLIKRWFWAVRPDLLLLRRARLIALLAGFVFVSTLLAIGLPRGV